MIWWPMYSKKYIKQIWWRWVGHNWEFHYWPWLWNCLCISRNTYNSCKSREAQGQVSKCHDSGVFISKEGQNFLEEVCLISVGIVVLWTLQTLIHVYYRKIHILKFNCSVFITRYTNLINWKSITKIDIHFVGCIWKYTCGSCIICDPRYQW